MFWKKLPYWLKGGLIGLAVAILLVLIAFLLNSFIEDISVVSLMIMFILSIPSCIIVIFGLFILSVIFFIFGSELPGGGGPEPVTMAIFLSAFMGILINGFLIGTLIGFIICKIKSKK